MARIEKYSTGIIGIIKHNIREFSTGFCLTNSEVNPEKSCDNYSLIRRGETAKEIDAYRQQIEREIFSYNRKNLVHACEVVCTLPADCPPEQEQLFFRESFNFICSTLPMGEKCVFLAEVHSDEGRIDKDGVTVLHGKKHMHVMYVPAAKDTTHEGYDYRLCAKEFTSRPVLLKWHEKYQKFLDNAGVQATVSNGKTSGRGISVKSLKEITKATGLNLEQIYELRQENKVLYDSLISAEKEAALSKESLVKNEKIFNQLADYAQRHDVQLNEAKKEIDSLKNIMIDKDRELQQLREQLEVNKEDKIMNTDPLNQLASIAQDIEQQYSQGATETVAKNQFEKFQEIAAKSAEISLKEGEKLAEKAIDSATKTTTKILEKIGEREIII